MFQRLSADRVFFRNWPTWHLMPPALLPVKTSVFLQGPRAWRSSWHRPQVPPYGGQANAHRLGDLGVGQSLGSQLGCPARIDTGLRRTRSPAAVNAAFPGCVDARTLSLPAGLLFQFGKWPRAVLTKRVPADAMDRAEALPYTTGGCTRVAGLLLRVAGSVHELNRLPGRLSNRTSQQAAHPRPTSVCRTEGPLSDGPSRRPTAPDACKGLGATTAVCFTGAV